MASDLDNAGNLLFMMLIKKKLAKELTFVLILKVFLLFFLYKLFFSHPIDKAERLPRTTEYLFDIKAEKNASD